MDSSLVFDRLFGPMEPLRTAKGRPDASREPYWSLLGPIVEPCWDPFWNHFGTLLGWFLYAIGIGLESFWDDFGVIWGSFGTIFPPLGA